MNIMENDIFLKLSMKPCRLFEFTFMYKYLKMMLKCAGELPIDKFHASKG